MRLSNNASLFFSVGEPSGDLHAANLLHNLRSHHAQINARGFGGKKMAAAGCKIDFELTEMAVIGLLEVIPKLRSFFRVADQASAIFHSNRPDAVLLVDFPGFNWHIARRAKEQGIPVFYYLPPQLWAWGSWRLKKMKRYVDHVLCSLPFEPQWYAERGMQVDYVGHPFFDEIYEGQMDTGFLGRWSEHDGLQLGILPGSRTREVKHIWPMQLAAIRELSQRYPRTRFMVACLKESHRELCRQSLRESDKAINLHLFVGKTSEIIEIADCALMKSGSVSLEMMGRGTPAVVVYHAGRTLYEVARRLSTVDSFSLPNLIAGKTIMPEFLAIANNKRPTIERTIAALDRLLGDRDERMRQRSELCQLTERFGQPGASRRAAEIIASRMGLSHTVPQRAAA